MTRGLISDFFLLGWGTDWPWQGLPVPASCRIQLPIYSSQPPGFLAAPLSAGGTGRDATCLLPGARAIFPQLCESPADGAQQSHARPMDARRRGLRRRFPLSPRLYCGQRARSWVGVPSWTQVRAEAVDLSGPSTMPRLCLRFM